MGSAECMGNVVWELRHRSFWCDKRMKKELIHSHMFIFGGLFSLEHENCHVVSQASGFAQNPEYGLQSKTRTRTIGKMLVT